MAYNSVSGVIVNKLTKAQYDSAVSNNELTSEQITNEVFIFTDDQHVSASEKATWNAKSDFSGSYNDLTDKPTIPSVTGLASETYVDTKIADLVNSAPTTLDTLGEIATVIEENEDVVTALNSAIGNKANTSDLAAVATSGSYNDLADKPSIPTVPTNVSAFNNDAGYLTAIPGEFVTESELNAKGYLTEHQDISDLATKDELFSGSYNDLTNKPEIPTAITRVWS